MGDGKFMLELVNVSKQYKDIAAVQSLSFQISKGEIMGLIGENGAGKSTTISMIATLIKPDEGSILFEDEDIVKHPGKMRKGLGLVPQDIALYESLTGYDNVLFWGNAHHVSEQLIQSRLLEICQMVSFSPELLKRKVKEYSGGMKRKLNIIVALLHHPRLVIMDEPTVGIDIVSRNQILKGIVQLRQNGTSVIYIGHYMEEIEQICDKIVVLSKGKCVLNKTIEEATHINGNKISLEKVYLDLMK